MKTTSIWKREKCDKMINQKDLWIFIKQSVSYLFAYFGYVKTEIIKQQDITDNILTIRDRHDGSHNGCQSVIMWIVKQPLFLCIADNYSL